MNKTTKILFLCFTFLALQLASFARPVDLQTAQSVASKFMETNKLQLVSTYQTAKNVAAFYVFNTTDGFIIVSADDCETPIIAYSYEGRFDPNNVPLQMEEYLQDFVSIIQYGIENHIEADKRTARQWELVKATGRLNEQKTAQSVVPLLTSTWNQGCLYNSLCPAMTGPCDHAEAGCVALAMGQIMRYWEYPATGFGSHSYVNAGVMVSADFGSTTYDWDHMPDALTESSTEAEIAAVATLLYHCGISVDMFYTTNGSGANSGDVPDALYRYFSYSKQAHREKRANYDDETWLSMLRHDLDLQRPVLYSGGNDQGAHAFVCDGYDDNGMLHFNWGWSVANGYFALGNLNPNGHSFNKNHYAVFDIIPQYEPCVVTVTVYPDAAGTIEGAGEYHIGERCTLSALPSEDYEFYCWKRNGQIISNSPTTTFVVNDEALYIEAHFSLYPVGDIAAAYSPDASNPNSPNVSLSWSRTDTDWTFIKQFEIGQETGGMTTDGEYIYVTYPDWSAPSFVPYTFGKYTLDGELVEKFRIEGISNALCLAYDGAHFYTNLIYTPNDLSVLYRLDFDNRIIIDSTDMGIWFGELAFDPEYDGFWLGQNNKTTLFDRQGQRIKSSPSTPDYIYGTAYYTARDGSPHLLLQRESGIYDYDINSNVINDKPLISFNGNTAMGICTGTYDGKEALFVREGEFVSIYEDKSTLSQIKSYRIYRSDSEGNTIMLADEVNGSSYIDQTWEDAVAGMYRFGISEVFANGVESEIIWSEPIEKTDFGIEEDLDDTSSPSVQKVFENGHIVIIKDGKRYTLTGQQLN